MTAALRSRVGVELARWRPQRSEIAPAAREQQTADEPEESADRAEQERHGVLGLFRLRRREQTAKKTTDPDRTNDRRDHQNRDDNVQIHDCPGLIARRSEGQL